MSRVTPDVPHRLCQRTLRRPAARRQRKHRDRGYQFADGIYRGCVRLITLGASSTGPLHLDRLKRSSGRSGPAAYAPGRAAASVAEVVRRNRVTEGMLYMQVTRGVARRDKIDNSAVRAHQIEKLERLKAGRRSGCLAGSA